MRAMTERRTLTVVIAAYNEAEALPLLHPRLAAVLPSPRRYSAGHPGPYVQRRTRGIERQMRQLGPGYLDGL